MQTTTRVARGNNQVERANRLILAIISKLSSREREKWYQNVAQMQKAMNIRPEDRMLKLLDKEQKAQFTEDRREMRKVAKLIFIKRRKRISEAEKQSTCTDPYKVKNI
ncbi:uncharacterized protein [Drosophila bipectinata]|uniref:uncharacterized protein n=1 Tax=Drosophila bipectinata TaxID=42026 RepID=UPI0038B41745